MASRMRSNPAVAWLSVAAALLASSPARAFDEELQLGGDAFYAYEIDADDAAHGVGAAVRMRYGLTDAIGVVAAVAWTSHFNVPESEDPLRHRVTGAAGVVYALDVFRIVPYLAIWVGAAVDPMVPTAWFAVRGSGGFDFLWTRAVSSGLEVSYELLVGEEVVPGILTIAIRTSWHRLV